MNQNTLRIKSPYLLFAKDYRPIVKLQNPDATFGELGRLIAEAYTKLTESEKQIYIDKANKQKEHIFTPLHI